MGSKRTVILGAGLAGLSVSFFLKKQGIHTVVFEKENEWGGLCRSRAKGGFSFDYSGHLLHFRSHRIRALVQSLLSGLLRKHRRAASIYLSSRMISYPFQKYFTQLPPAIAKECRQGLKAVSGNGAPRADYTFLQWAYATFGKGIAEHFMIPYNRKFWTIPLDELSFQWAQRFIVTPKRRKREAGSGEDCDAGTGYHARFWYPTQGGISVLPAVFAHGAGEVRLAHEVIRIDTRKRVVTFKNGRRQAYDTLISTIPLPEMSRLLSGVPSSVKRAFEKLRWVSIYNLNLGIRRSVMPGKHWIYYPQDDLSFFRVGFTHNFAPHSVPAGCGSLYVEASYRNGSINKPTLTERMIRELAGLGIIKGAGEVCCADVCDMPYAYPVYDLSYSSARRLIFSFFSQKNILPCGRYGSWRYLSMEDVILDSEDVAHACSTHS